MKPLLITCILILILTTPLYIYMSFRSWASAMDLLEGRDP